MDLSWLRADMTQVRHLYPSHQCRIVWEGFPYSPSGDGRQQLLLPDWYDPQNASHSREILWTATSPPLYGYNGIHILDEQDAAHPARQLYLWCGPMYQLFAAFTRLVGKVGLRVGFFPPPYKISAELFLLGVSNNFLLAFIPIMLPAFNIIPIFGPLVGQYAINIDYGSIISRRQTIRKDFLFLKTFEPAAWLAILASCLVVAIIFTAGRSIAKKFVLSARKFFANVNYWCHVTLFLVSFLLGGEGEVGFRTKPRWLFGIWLLVCTLVAGCMNGSMRDLMSQATELVVPHCWDDLFTMEEFSSKFTALVEFFPEWPIFEGLYLQNENENIAAIDSRLYVLSLGHPVIGVAELFRGGVQILNTVPVGELVMIIPRVVYHIAYWIFNIFYHVLDQYTGKQLDEIFESKMSPLAYLGITSQSIPRYRNLFREHFIEQVHISEARDSSPYFFPYGRFSPRWWIPIMNNFFVTMRENGFMTAGYSGAEEMLDRKISETRIEGAAEENGVTEDGGDESDSGPKHTPIIMEDLTGPFILYASILGLSAAVVCLEIFLSKKYR